MTDRDEENLRAELKAMAKIIDSIGAEYLDEKLYYIKEEPGMTYRDREQAFMRFVDRWL